MKVELSIDDVRDLLEMYFEKYAKAKENYYELSTELIIDPDVEPEKNPRLYSYFCDINTYAAKHRHWLAIFNEMKSFRK